MCIRDSAVTVLAPPLEYARWRRTRDHEHHGYRAFRFVGRRLHAHRTRRGRNAHAFALRDTDRRWNRARHPVPPERAGGVDRVRRRDHSLPTATHDGLSLI